MDKFILLAGRRSGTTLLVRSLDSHPQLECHKNAFDVDSRFKYFVVDRPTGKFYRFRTASVQRRLDYVLHRQHVVDDFLNEMCLPANGAMSVGVRLAYVQADKHPEVIKWAIANDVAVIHLVRENALKTLVSRATSAKRGVRHSTEKVKRVTVHLPPRQLKRHLGRLTRQIEKYRRLLAGSRHLEVTYESFVAQREAETQRLLSFLNVDRMASLSSNLVKLNPDSLADIIENYREVEAALRGTRFEKFLD